MSKIAYSIADIETLLKDDRYVKVAGVDTNGILRGKILSKKKFLATLKHGFGFSSAIFNMDVRDRVLDEVTNVPTTDTGYGDLLARADLTSLRRIPWEENIPFFMLDFLSPLDNQPVAMCPRSLLKRMIHELTVMGFQPMCGMELEFFNFKETSQSLKEKHYQQLTTVTPNSSCYSMVLPTEQHDYYYALLNQCHQFGIPLECLHTECGPGVYEAAIEYAPALEAADRAQLFKMAAKQIALQHGIIASFMAKPFYGLAGCSGHIHLSLVDRTNGKNVFATQNSMEVDTDTTVSARGMSDVMQAFVAGLIQGLPSIMAMLAPNINSYKRLVANHWAPIAVGWGYENRTTALRVITTPSCSHQSTRVEIRVPGADLNPHLALAACLACGIYGLRNKCTLPPPLDTVMTTADQQTRLPRNLKEAIDLFEQPNSIPRQMLGDAFVDHYATHKRHEWNTWSDAITDWELQRYLEFA